MTGAIAEAEAVDAVVTGLLIVFPDLIEIPLDALVKCVRLAQVDLPAGRVRESAGVQPEFAEIRRWRADFCPSSDRQWGVVAVAVQPNQASDRFGLNAVQTGARCVAAVGTARTDGDVVQGKLTDGRVVCWDGGVDERQNQKKNGCDCGQTWWHSYFWRFPDQMFKLPVNSCVYQRTFCFYPRPIDKR